MSTLFAIFLISFFMAMFISVISIVIYNFAFIQPQFNNLEKNFAKDYNYNPNILWVESVIQTGLPAQYTSNPPPELPHT